MKAIKKVSDLMDQFDAIKKQIASLETVKRVLEFDLLEAARLSPDKKLENKTHIATYVQASRVSYDIDQMNLELPRDVVKQLVDVEYVVDKAAMRELFEDHPEVKKLVIRALKKVVAVNNKKVEEAHSNGIVSVEELRKCSKVQTSEYIKMYQKGKS